MTFARSLFLTVLIHSLSYNFASAQEPADAAQSGPATAATAVATIRRDISLAELGFRRGIEFSGLNGSQDVFFPVPAKGLQSAMLHLQIHSGSAFKSRRSIQIHVAGKIVATQALGENDEDTAIDVPIDISALDGQFLPVSIVYSGAVTEDRCLDQRVSGDYVSILPSSALDLQLKPAAMDSVRSVIALMPRKVTVLVPDQPLSEVEAEALLHISSMLNSRGSHVAYARYQNGDLKTEAPQGKWSEGRIIIATSLQLGGVAQASGESKISVVNLSNGPAILVDGKNPDAGARFIASRWRAIADVRSLSITTTGERDQNNEALTFADLGTDVSTRSLVDRTVFDVAFKATDLPAGTQPARLNLDLAIANDFAGTNATIAAFMNDMLLASTTSTGDVPARLTASIPAGLFHQNNAIRVVVQRQPQTGDCANPPQGFPVQLLPSSSVQLEAGSDRPQDFFQLSSAFGDGVTVFVPEGTASGDTLWPVLAKVVADLVPATAPIDVKFGMPGKAIAKPFILVSPTLPSIMNAPVRFDTGRVVITGSGDKPLLDVGGFKDQGLAELVYSPAAAGLWIHPGEGGMTAGDKLTGLDRGNVALLGNGEVSFSFSTERDRLVQVKYPERTSYLDLVRQYRPWLIGAGWLILTIAFIFGLSRLYRRRSG